MAKLSKAVLKTSYSANQPVSELLEKTRATIEDVKSMVEKEFQGEYLEQWRKRIAEYESSCGSSSEKVLTAEEEYTQLQRVLEEKKQRIGDIPKEVEALLAKIESLEAEKTKLEDDVTDVQEKLDKLEKEITIHVVFPNTFYSSIEAKYNFVFKPIEEFVNSVTDSEIFIILSKIFNEIPAQMQFTDVINMIRTIVFIKQMVAEGRRIRVYVPKELVEIFTKNTNLDEASILTD